MSSKKAKEMTAVTAVLFFSALDRYRQLEELQHLSHVIPDAPERVGIAAGAEQVGRVVRRHERNAVEVMKLAAQF